MLIQLSDAQAVTKALEEEGFVQGHYDEEKNIIVEATRKEKRRQKTLLFSDTFVTNSLYKYFTIKLLYCKYIFTTIEFY